MSADVENDVEKEDGVGKDDFETKLSRLDEIVAELESGDVPLQKAIALFEEGLQLSQKCSKLLEDAQLRVQKLLERVDGGADTQPMEPNG